MSGGDKLQAYLANIAANLAAKGGHPSVRVGFLEGIMYPDGTPVAMIAAQNEFGATINRAPSSVTINRLPKLGGGYLRGGRFVKARTKGAVASTHAVGAYTIVIPPRPFFRRMIKAKGPTWGADVAKWLKSTGYNVMGTLGFMGEKIAGQLGQSIQDTTDPPNAPSTIKRKGFDKPLIDTSVMWKSIAYEIKDA